MPEETYDFEVKAMMKVVMKELDERKEHNIRMEHARKDRERDEEELEKLQRKYNQETEKDWEQSRDKRVRNWNKFRDRMLHGKKKAKFEVRAPLPRLEEAPKERDFYAKFLTQ